MERVVEDFILYLHETKNTSKNTEVSYERDLKKLIRYLQEQNLTGFSEVTCTDLQGYLNKIKSENLAASTISRNIASIRALYHYLIKTGIVSEDPTEALHTPKIEKKLPEILSVEEVDRLLKQPDIRTPKGIRDNAMMELLYATGMRVSELIHLKTTDINLQMGYVVCHDSDKERIIPIGNVSSKCNFAIYGAFQRLFYKRYKRECTVYELLGEIHEQTGILESTERICGRCRNPQRYHTAYTSPFFCGTYAAERGRM